LDRQSDLYLLPLARGDDFESAMSLFNALDARQISPELTVDVRPPVLSKI
jgi:hypothetical protein